MTLKEFYQFSQTPSGSDAKLAALKKDLAASLKRNYPQKFGTKNEMPSIKKVADLKAEALKKNLTPTSTTTNPATNTVVGEATNSLKEELKALGSERKISGFLKSEKIGIDKAISELGISTKATTEAGKVKAIFASLKQ